VVNQVSLNAFHLHSDDTWTDRVRNKEVLLTVKDNNILYTIKRGKIIGLVTSCIANTF